MSQAAQFNQYAMPLSMGVLALVLPPALAGWCARRITRPVPAYGAAVGASAVLSAVLLGVGAFFTSFV